MSRSKENVETILTETLRSTPQEEMDAAAARVLQCLRSESPIMQEVM